MARSRWIVGLAAAVSLGAGCGGGGSTNNEPPPPPKRTLTINFSGAGTGTVSSTPTGINCSSGPCAAMFDQDTMITLSASPGAGSTFAGWSGGGCGGTGPCTFPMPASDTTITATFDLVPVVTHKLTVSVGGPGNGNVSSAPGGINCNAPNSCEALFTEGADVILTAAPNADGSTFAGWGGDCSSYGTATSCTVNMSAAKTVSAAFNAPPPKFRLSVSVTGPGSGSVTSDPTGINCSSGTCTWDYFENTVVTLTATPATGGTDYFAGWSGEGCSGTGTCQVTMSAARSVTATFSSRQTLNVTILGDGVGTVTSVPAGISCSSGTCSAVFDTGTNVTLTGVAAAGSGFYGWSPYCDGDSGPCSFTLGSSATYYATFTKWDVRRPFPDDLRGIAKLGSTLIAVGTGAFVTSPATDGIAWTGHELASTAKLRAVAADAGGTVAVAVGEGGLVLSSTDAATWTARDSKTTAQLNSVAHGGGVYVAVGNAGAIVSSSNGTDWTARTSNTPYDLLGVAYGSGRFVAVGVGGTILTSLDGADWSAPTSPSTQMLTGVAYDAMGGFVAVGSLGAVLTSGTGTSWTLQGESIPLGASVTVRGVAAGGGTYVAISSSHAIFYSANGGINWTVNGSTEDLEGTTVTGIGVAGGAFYALSDGGMSRSPAATAWTRVVTLRPNFYGMAYGASTYVAVGHAAILSSPDGLTWTYRWAGNPYLRYTDYVTSVIYANSRFIAPSGHGILSSTDGLSWTQVGPAPNMYGGYVAWGGAAKGFVVVAYAATDILVSLDGATWTRRTSGITGITLGLNGIVYGGSTFVAVGGDYTGPAIFTNADPYYTGGWVQQSTTGMTSALGTVLYGNSTFVAASADAWTSANTVNWSGPFNTTPARSMRLIAYGGGIFLTSGTILSSTKVDYPISTDGQVWTTMQWRPAGMGYFSAGTYDGPNGWVVTDGVRFAVHAP